MPIKLDVPEWIVTITNPRRTGSNQLFGFDSAKDARRFMREARKVGADCKIHKAEQGRAHR